MSRGQVTSGLVVLCEVIFRRHIWFQIGVSDGGRKGGVDRQRPAGDDGDDCDDGDA